MRFLRSDVTLKIGKELLKRARNNKVKLHSVDVERRLLPKGEGSLSTSRYMRLLRQYGYIDYPDPRINNHTYDIKITGEFKKLIKKLKNKNKNKNENKNNNN